MSAAPRIRRSKRRLNAPGTSTPFNNDHDADGVVIDMHGIALREKPIGF